MRKEEIKRNKAKLIDFEYILFDIGKIPVIIPGLIWLRPKWTYENDAAKRRIRGGAILMVNHSGFTDPILAQFAVWYRRQHFVAAKELFEGKVRNKLFHIFHCIEVDRENFNIGTFRSITDHLDGGKIVTIYPEGHINMSEGAVDAFKSGVVMMALRSGKPIVPVYTKAPAKIWNRAVFCIGQPVNLREEYGPMPTMDEIREISERLRKKELELEKIIQKGNR